MHGWRLSSHGSCRGQPKARHREALFVPSQDIYASRIISVEKAGGGPSQRIIPSHLKYEGYIEANSKQSTPTRCKIFAVTGISSIFHFTSSGLIMVKFQTWKVKASLFPKPEARRRYAPMRVTQTKRHGLRNSSTSPKAIPGILAESHHGEMRSVN